MSLSAIKPSVGIILQARMGSTRLPGKVLMDLMGGHTVVGYLLRRLQQCRHVDKVIVATTTSSKDDVLVKWLEENKYSFYRGSEKDCLDRYYQAAGQHKLDIIVRITTDCVFVIPDVVDDMLEYYLANLRQIDYLSNRSYTNFPEGVDVEIFSYAMLKDAKQYASGPDELEHINYYFLRNDNKFRIRYYNHGLGIDYSRFKLSIDTAEDLERARRLFKDKGLSFFFSLKELAGILTKG